MRSPAPPGLQMSPGKSLTTHKDALSYRIAFLWKGVVIKSAAPGRLYLRAGPRFVNNHLCDRTVIDPRARSLSNDVFSNASSTRLNRVSITPSFYPVSCYSGLTDFLCSCIPPLVSPSPPLSNPYTHRCYICISVHGTIERNVAIRTVDRQFANFDFFRFHPLLHLPPSSPLFWDRGDSPPLSSFNAGFFFLLFFFFNHYSRFISVRLHTWNFRYRIK